MSGFEVSIEESLFDDHRIALKQYLMRYLSSRQDVEDISQEAYIQAYHVMSNQQVDYPKALLFKIAFRLAVDLIRKQARTTQLNQPIDEESHLITQTTSPEKQLAGQQAFNLMCEAVVELPPKCQQVFILHRFYNKAYAEIAEELAISSNTVQRHMIKAIKHCRQHMKELKRQKLI